MYKKLMQRIGIAHVNFSTRFKESEGSTKDGKIRNSNVPNFARTLNILTNCNSKKMYTIIPTYVQF